MFLVRLSLSELMFERLIANNWSLSSAHVCRVDFDRVVLFRPEAFRLFVFECRNRSVLFSLGQTE